MSQTDDPDIDGRGTRTGDERTAEGSQRSRKTTSWAWSGHEKGWSGENVCRRGGTISLI